MKKILLIASVLVGIFILSFGWIFFRIHKTAQLDRAEKADAIAVLGAAAYAGKPSPVFQARLDHAVKLYRQDLALFVITTGGTHPGEKFSEGAVGKKYLEKKGIPAENILVDEQSLTTRQNVERISEIAREKNFQKIIIVSDPFHMYRALMLAKKFGIEALPSPTRESPISENKWLETRYMLREMILTFLTLFT